VLQTKERTASVSIFKRKMNLYTSCWK